MTDSGDDKMENDPLKEFFRSLPEIVPSENLKNRILLSLESGGAQKEFWALKPAIVFASYLLLAFLGSALSTSYLQTKLVQKESSPLMRWVQSHPDMGFLKPSL